MIKRGLSLLFALMFIFSVNVKADEGMWLLSLIGKNYQQMKAQGLKLTPEDIYNVNHASLKDAVVGLGNAQQPFGFFCTGEIISSKGLVLTNHHCGFGQIQAHSSVEHDYLKDGFWALNYDQEFPAEGMVMTRLVSMEDVTAKALEGVTDAMSETERADKIASNKKAIIKDAKKGTKYGADVKTMFAGNQFFLFIYETFKDIRLVGAPPQAVGKFGGDTDNWMWPRHTGDFSIFRIYANKDNKPAKYSKDNVPYNPVHHLPVSIKGVEKGDFAMVMGFPGSTERFLTSYGVKEALDISNPTTVKIRTEKLRLMKEDMNTSDKIRIQYASKYAQTANYWKYFQGQSKALKKNHIYEKKQAQEKKLQEWINSNDERKAKYGQAFPLISKFYEDNKSQQLAYTYLLEALIQGPEIILFPMQMRQFAGLLENPKENAELIKKNADKAKESSKEHWKDYNLPTDKKIFASLLDMYYKNVPAEYQLPIFKDVVAKKFKGNFTKFADEVYKKSIFASEENFNKFMDKPTKKALSKDYAYILMQQTIDTYFKLGGGKTDDFRKGKRLFEAALMEMNPDKLYYPDANSTIRLTYGNVGDYQPADAVHYDYFTTTKGILEKEDPTNDEFIVPKKLKELILNKDYGQYIDKDGTMHVAFTTNNDITGGNSGSPVINGNGELIGTAFDGNWEAMSGDIVFEKKLQKCIDVDIRYTLFIIDKLGGAHNLIEEMTIVK